MDGNNCLILSILSLKNCANILARSIGSSCVGREVISFCAEGYLPS